MNVVGNRNLFQAAAEQAAEGPMRLVMASSDQLHPTRFARYRPTDGTTPKTLGAGTA
ncbi:hypothetical protein [Falsirhodobacter sp. 1013]|uniref:hypothetical protein n=1 Tax=Falsirhodobacter sp. 1013 TaxID=3417566 RepID=UPI003EBE5994